jgi:hypothetical protein
MITASTESVFSAFIFFNCCIARELTSLCDKSTPFTGQDRKRVLWQEDT